MVIQKLVVKKRRHIHSAFQNTQEGMHDQYFQTHVNTHRRVNKQVLDCLEEIGEF